MENKDDFCNGAFWKRISSEKSEVELKKYYDIVQKEIKKSEHLLEKLRAFSVYLEGKISKK